MYALLVPALAAIAATMVFVIHPLYVYFRDEKDLRKYPAMNWLAGISNLGFMYEAAVGFRSDKLYRLHQIHPVIRTGPNALSFAGGQAIKDIYGHGSPCNKDTFYSTLAGSHHHLADVVDRPEHARKRKVLSAAYALKNLEDWEFKVADKTERFLRACDRACTKPLPADTCPDAADLTFDYRQYTNFFTLDAIADIGLSERLGFLDQGSDECEAEEMDGVIKRVRFREALHATGLAQTRLVWAAGWYGFNVWASRLLSRRFRQLWRLNTHWNGIVYRRARVRLDRYKAGEPLSDFFQSLMHDRTGRPHALDWGEIVAEVSIMMNAGSDTTALAMVNVMYHLLRHPDVLAKLRIEVDGALQPDEVVAPYQKVKYLPYLRAVLDESLRLTPPTTFGLPRRTPPEGVMVGSEHIAGDTTVSISAWVAHRDPVVFPDPERFMPERWLGDEARELQSGFVAFSTGARGCIGRNISYLEQTVLLASVVHRYELALPSENWEPERWETTNYMMKEMPVKVWRREVELKEE
ncbi:cytochrome p450 monooxygenase [Grosmannia clavigera kw1407]|uniref:Cytochrome p450 monooxygenase n=1 Tax=Grosmannia clavigera (strain kw1407 / UAMH 11150) TaxID=655863 RepID=F0XBA3_GROCL|nr:cytochrome p450 monooxygenase [Grosmannia clavigera kw1407]EFX05103.1 cytochrome p450 monooxygenase [Grosmannia clavigera kw1407]